MLDINKAKEDTTVVVAMSGGVDSSVVAAMLTHEGYKVIGITLQLYDHGMTIGKKGACCAGNDIYDAQMVASKLGIPHYVLDYESRFREEVIDDFADSYLRGETPLPCVRCNQSVKFVDLVKMAKDLGADCLATGHYVQRKNGPDGAELHRGIDPTKDQSYFLFATKMDQLEFLRFPLGGMKKDETRKIAEKFGLVVADKPDSQDICFVPDGSYARLVEKLRPGSNKEGKIVHIDGFELGKHNGIINYTIGQRRKIGIAFNDPLYVVRIDPEANIVYVGPESALGSTEFVIKEVNWLGVGDKPVGNFEVKVKTRYRQDFFDATIVPMEDNMMRVILHSEQKSITPGQACVIYDGTRLLGGGWITRLP
ncbi:MAG: tRNA 2-thiouridine(34) synthase MnmA [Rickettsiaceae bacterium]|nr:tRNA 2-thiouridine(34) synthase MnmA [Rickettsiaceae bacterium]